MHVCALRWYHGLNCVCVGQSIIISKFVIKIIMFYFLFLKMLQLNLIISNHVSFNFVCKSGGRTSREIIEVCVVSK